MVMVTLVGGRTVTGTAGALLMGVLSDRLAAFDCDSVLVVKGAALRT